MVHRLGLAVIALALIGVTRESPAAPIIFFANLSGAGETPPTSPGTGTARVDFDLAAHSLHIHVEFSGLIGTTTASHIHSPTAAPFTGSTAVATQVPSFVGFPLGVTSGVFDNTLNTSLASTYNPAFVASNGGSVPAAESALFSSLLAGTAYLNIHTSSTQFPTFSGGEIRGFLTAVPEPSSIVLLGIGALGIVACTCLRAVRKRA